MSFWSKLFGKSDEDTFVLDEKTLYEVKVCPNCWGKQEYADLRKKYEEDQAKYVVNKNRTHQKAFIQKFVQEHISGIVLREEGKNLACPRCKN